MTFEHNYGPLVQHACITFILSNHINNFSSITNNFFSFFSNFRNGSGGNRLRGKFLPLQILAFHASTLHPTLSLCALVTVPAKRWSWCTPVSVAPGRLA